MRPACRWLIVAGLALLAQRGMAAEPVLSHQAVHDLLFEAHALDDDDPCLRHALTLIAVSRWGDQEELLARCALDMREKALGSDHALLSGWLQQVGMRYQSQRRYAEAIPLFERAVAIEDRRARGGEHSDLAPGMALESLGWTYWLDGRYPEAEATMRRLLARLESQKPRPPDFVFARTLYFIGSALHGQGKLAEAEPFYRRAVLLGRPKDGRGPDQSLEYMSDLAALLAQRGKMAEAQAMAARVRKAIAETPEWYRKRIEEVMAPVAGGRARLESPPAPRVRMAFAGPARVGPLPERAAAMPVGNCDDIFPAFLGAVQKFRGEEHPAAVPFIYIVGSCAEQAGNLKGAQEQYRQAVVIREKAFGIDDPRTRASRRVLARLEGTAN